MNSNENYSLNSYIPDCSYILSVVFKEITFLDENQKRILKDFLEDTAFIKVEYIDKKELGKMAFHFQQILKLQLAKSLKLSESVFSAFRLIFYILYLHDIYLFFSYMYIYIYLFYCLFLVMLIFLL